MRSHRVIVSTLTGLFICLLHIGKLSAQVNGEHLLDSLTVTESLVRSATESSAPLQRLSSRDLQRLGATNAADALKFMSGVTVKDYGGVGGLKTIGVRGLGAQHTAVFYDGVAVGDCQSGQVDLGRYSTGNLGGVELLIGQGDDIYRTARMLSAAGVVSLESKVADDGKPSGEWEVYGRTGSYDSYKGSIRHSRTMGKGWTLSAFGEYATSQGDYHYTIKNPVTTVSGRRKNSDIDELRGEVNLAWQPDKHHHIRVKLYAYDSDRGLPGGVIVENPITTENLKSKNIFGQIFYEYIASKTLKMKFALKHNAATDRHNAPIATGVSTNRYRQHESDLSYTAMWSPKLIKGLSVAWSEELFRNKLTTTNSHVDMPTAPQRLTTLSAISARYTYRALSLTGSLLHTYATESAPSGSVAPDKSRFSPSVALLFYPLPGEDLCLRASYKSIFRMPTFNDLYYREIGNYKLAPEKSKQWNIGVAYSMHPTAWCNQLTLTADAYHGKVEDKIVAVPNVFMWKMSNVDQVEIIGADLGTKATFTFTGGTHINLAATYSYMQAVNRTKGSPLYEHRIVYTPLHSGSADLSITTPIANIGYTLLWSGSRYHLAQNIPSNEIRAYTDHSLWLSRCWNIGKYTMLTKAEVKNIGDKNYEIIRYYPMPGRNYALTFILTL